MMRRLTMGGKVVIPRAVGAAFALLEFFSCQCVVGGVLAVPGDPTTGPPLNLESGLVYSVGVVGRGATPVLSVLPCQFSSLVIFIH
jgi:hypothetical protein